MSNRVTSLEEPIPPVVAVFDEQPRLVEPPTEPLTPAPPAPSTMRRLLAYVKPHTGLLILGFIASIGSAGIQLGTMAIAAQVVKSLLKSDGHLLAVACVAVVGGYALRWFFAWGQQVYFAEVGQRVGVQIKSEVYRHLQKLSLSFFDRSQTGSLMSAITNDVPVISGDILSMKDMVSAPLLTIGGIAIILWISWKLSLFTVLLLPVIAYFLNVISKRLKEVSIQTQDRLAEVSTTMEETLGAVRLVRAFVTEDREIERFERQILEAKEVSMYGVRRGSALAPTTDLIGSIGIAFAIWVGGHLVLTGSLQVYNLLFFVGTLDRIRTGVGGMSNAVVTWRNLQGVAGRLFTNVLDVPTEVLEKPNAIELPKVKGEVRFDDVSFSYISGTPVLKNISFAIFPGQVVAIVGESGSGKSTLSDLIPRFYDPTGGTITVDGYDTRELSLASLRSQIGIVDQVTSLFGGTVRENISYGRPNATQEQIEAAARHANAHDFIIAQMPKGYDTIVGQRGIKLSGGQRQRLAIARALLTDPRILILDEATSSLDTASEQLVQEALDKLMHGRTTLVIAHRLSTIVNADKILVMHQGSILEAGTHAELLERGGRYANLYETQYRHARGGNTLQIATDSE